MSTKAAHLKPLLPFRLKIRSGANMEAGVQAFGPTATQLVAEHTPSSKVMVQPSLVQAHVQLCNLLGTASSRHLND